MNNDSFYTVDNINDFIEIMWKRRLTALTTTPSLNVIQRRHRPTITLPHFRNSKYEANNICEIVVKNSFSLADYALEMSEKSSPLCDCESSEETVVHYVHNCKVHNEFRPKKMKK